MKRNKHLSLEERSIIERLVQAGKSNKAIAEVLGRTTSTIGQELSENAGVWSVGRIEVKPPMRLQKNVEGMNGNRGFLGKFCRKSSNFTTRIGVLNRFLGHWNCEVFTSATKRFIAGFMRKFVRDGWRKIKGTFWKKLPLNPQKVLLIVQHCCAMNENFKGVWEIFYKKSLNSNTSRSQFSSGIWPFERRYRWTGSWAKLSCHDGRTQYAVFGGGTCQK